MSYYFSKVLTCDFDKAVERVTLALKGAGFGRPTGAAAPFPV